MWAMPMPLVTIEDEGGHLWATADVKGLDMGTTAHVKRRHMWATPMDMVDDEGHKLLEACSGNPIGGIGTLGATNHPNTRIVAQSTLDYFNNKFDLSYKLVRIVGATWTFLGPFRSKYLISMEVAASEEHKPTKYFVRTYERFIMGVDSNKLNFSVCVPWDIYVMTKPPRPNVGEWMATVEATDEIERMMLLSKEISKAEKALNEAWELSREQDPKEIAEIPKEIAEIPKEIAEIREKEIAEILEKMKQWKLSRKQDPKEIAEIQEKIEEKMKQWKLSRKQDPKEIAELEEKIEEKMKQWKLSWKQDPKEIAELQEKKQDPKEIAELQEKKQDPKEIAELQEKMETSAC